MRLNFKFTNLFGTAYKCGNLIYTNDGTCLISPVGNQVTIFHLIRDETRTIAINSQFNVDHVAISPVLPLLFTVNCNGMASLTSLLTGNVITHYSFRYPISALSFSPNGRYLAVAKNNSIMVFLAPDQTRSVNSLELYRFLYGNQDEIKNIDWSSDSNFLITGSNDMTARIFSVKKCQNLIVYTLSGHRSPVFSCFYDEDSLDSLTLGIDGEIRLWICNTKLKNIYSDSESGSGKALFRMSAKHIHRTSSNQRITETITAFNYHKKMRILITAFENGMIMLHELPDFILISKAKLMVDPINTVTINSSGDWIAVGSQEHGQLAVWEWRSESCHLRAESHANEMTSVAYSPDGLIIATAGRDSKVKVWQVSNGRALVTFSEHQAAVMQISFPSSKPKVILSASLDGTVRAFDLTRYRNFRTMSVPSRGVQLSSLATDGMGELVAAGSLDSFDAYVWSIRTGQLLTILTGHSSPVCTLEFNPGLELSGSLELATGSWDGTVRTWSLADCEAAMMTGGAGEVAGNTLTEVISLSSDVICLSYRRDGHEFAVAIITAVIIFFDAHDGRQLGSIEGRHDLDVAQTTSDDLVTPHRAAKERKFLSIAYSSDGEHLLAGGDSKYICLYSVPDRLLIKRFEITVNMSLGGVQEAHDRRRFLSHYGAESALSKEDGREALPLPGVRSGDDHSRRWWRPDVRVTSVCFSPTGDAFAATATEGVFIYSLAKAGLGGSILGGVNNWLFDALGVEEDTTPSNSRKMISERNYAAALHIALRIQMYPLIEEIIEMIPCDQVHYLSRNIPISLVIKCLIPFLARQLEGRSRHVAFYTTWADAVLQVHATTLRSTLAAVAQSRGELKFSSDDSNTVSAEKNFLKQPGVLIEHGEWRAFQASLVRLQTSLSTLKSRLVDRFEILDAKYEYLSTIAKLSTGPGFPVPPSVSDGKLIESVEQRRDCPLDDDVLRDIEVLEDVKMKKQKKRKHIDQKMKSKSSTNFPSKNSRKLKINPASC